MLEIKPFTENDYQTIADLENSVFTDEFFTEEGFREDDKLTPAHIQKGRFLAWQDGVAVGFAQFSQDAWQFHPQRFRFWVVVRPDFQRQGIGQKLWDTLLEAVKPHNPIGLAANTREDKFGLEFLKKRGLLEKMRTWENRIDLRLFDPSPYVYFKTQLEQQGIEIFSVAQLQAMHTDFATQYYQLNLVTGRDVPRAYPATDRTFEEWKGFNLKSPKALFDGTFIAVQNGEYVGMSQLFKSDGDYLTIGLTGVRREARGQHVALALKVACLEWAKHNHHPEIRTWNDSNNAPILALNQKLGFVQCPAWIDCIHELE